MKGLPWGPQLAGDRGRRAKALQAEDQGGLAQATWPLQALASHLPNGNSSVTPQGYNPAYKDTQCGRRSAVPCLILLLLQWPQPTPPAWSSVSLSVNGLQLRQQHG